MTSAAATLTYTQVLENEHYEIAQLNGLFHWESIEGVLPEVIGSEDGFESLKACHDEARETIQLASSFGVEKALELMTELEALLEKLYPADRQAIADAIEAMPLDSRWMAAYRMAKRTQPMPVEVAPLTDAEALAKVREIFQGYLDNGGMAVAVLDSIGSAVGSV